MCGICGVIGSTDPEPTQNVVRQMLGQMHHRGPDDEGVFVDESVALGMRRLSIIDLGGGHQPVFNEDRTVVVVFNGEIYNFQELRNTLEARGYHFQTNSDTEVIVYAYEEWGEDCVDHFEGMFAFALAETSKSTRRGNPRVLLARDRLGIKPLYYALVDGNLIFASEVRSLLASGQVEPRAFADRLAKLPSVWLGCGAHDAGGGRLFLAPRAPDHHFRRRAPLVRPPRALLGFRRIGVCPALETKKQERGSATAFLAVAPGRSRRVPFDCRCAVGVFLSSGIDSTALVALATQKKAALNTVTVVFPEQDYSEAALARRTAEQFGTNHQELSLTGDDMLARLNEAVGALDQPSMDGINTYFVSWAARQAGLKVALSGLGRRRNFWWIQHLPFDSGRAVRGVARADRAWGIPIRAGLRGRRNPGAFPDKGCSPEDGGIMARPQFSASPVFLYPASFHPHAGVGLAEGQWFRLGGTLEGLARSNRAGIEAA